MDTWTVRTGRITQRVSGGEVPQYGLLGVYNPPGSGVSLDLLSLNVLPPSAVQSSALLGAYQLRQLTAVSGGVALSFASHHDTTNSSLPVQVLARLAPETATLGALLRVQGDNPGVIQSAGVLYHRGLRSPSANLQMEALWQSGQGDVQPLTLREGEGFAVGEANPHGFPHLQGLCVEGRVQGTGATFTLSTPVMATRAPGECDGVAFALLNGAGSGVVLEILTIELLEEGLAMTSAGAFSGTLNCGLRLAFVDQPFSDGEVLMPMAHDTANGVLPAGMQFRRAPLVPSLRPPRVPVANMVEGDSGTTSLALWAQTKVGTFRGVLFPLLSLQTPMINLQPQRPLWQSVGGMRFRPGEGLALVHGYEGGFDADERRWAWSTSNNLDMEAVFTVSPAVAAIAVLPDGNEFSRGVHV